MENITKELRKNKIDFVVISSNTRNVDSLYNQTKNFNLDKSNIFIPQNSVVLKISNWFFGDKIRHKYLCYDGYNNKYFDDPKEIINHLKKSPVNLGGLTLLKIFQTISTHKLQNRVEISYSITYVEMACFQHFISYLVYHSETSAHLIDEICINTSCDHGEIKVKMANPRMCAHTIYELDHKDPNFFDSIQKTSEMLLSGYMDS